MKDVGGVVHFRRIVRGEMDVRRWTMAELSRRSGLTPSVVGRVLSGETNIYERHIKAFSLAFNIKVYKLFKEQSGLKRFVRNNWLTKKIFGCNYPKRA